MSYIISWQAQVSWLPDGAGAMSVPTGPTYDFTSNSATNVVVPGAATPTGANFTTACNTIAGNLSALLNAQPTLGKIQAVATGGN